jgi:hypothetical protein
VGILLVLSARSVPAQQPQLPPGGEKAGFPFTLSGGGAPHGEPVIADLGLTPGHESIVFGTSGRKLYVVSGTGRSRPGSR